MRQLYVEKKPAHRDLANRLQHDLREQLQLLDLKSLRILQRYSIEGLSEHEFDQASRLILSEPQIDDTYPTLSLSAKEHAFAVEYLPGQFDQRADSAAQAIQILTVK